MAKIYDIRYESLTEIQAKIMGRLMRRRRWSLRRRIADRLRKNNIHPGKHNIYHTPWSL